MQPYCGENNLELHYHDTDSFIFSFKPIKSLIEGLKYFREVFDFSELDLKYIQKLIRRSLAK